ncbi:MATE family efflux transporter [Mycoplasma phocoeninasale]|uniref:MATE family efflux transporter n=1 Tax=Mycoplasma phocoeninasale TaxID=2726117 RepID=A0A858U2R0_9MOLU|nr:MATE family efflux transporter [Mycoplasma phocoeninasale]QJG66329.1 MATE family efflux transporter [Mycoplasma phocoeninasale]
MNSLKIQKNIIRRIFPQSRADWKLYFAKTIPIVVGEILFCLNGFLDNFMVTSITGGIDALTYANTYTGILYTIFFAIQGIAAMFVGQYYGKKDYDKVKQIMNLRIWMHLVVALAFSIPSWAAGRQMIQIIGNQNINQETLQQGTSYLWLITISWIITAFNFNTNMLLNETGHSRFAMISATLTLLVNASINAIFILGLKRPAYYAAVGSIVGAVVCLMSDELLTYFKNRKIFINLFKLFHISKVVARQILRRSLAMLITIAAMITIPLRTVIWSKSFPDDIVNGSGIGQRWMQINGVTILGLVDSLSTVASAITSVCSSNVSYFVASNLGDDKFEEAEKHSHALKGFHAISGFIMSTIMLCIVLAIAFSSATSKGTVDGVYNVFYNKENKDYILSVFNESPTQNQALIQYINANGIPSPKQFVEYDSWVQNATEMTKAVFRKTFLLCCFTFLAFNPIWCWFYTSAALPRAGGRNNIASFTMLGAQWLSFVWLIIIGFAIVIPLRNTSNSLSLELAYFIFYSIDIGRLAIFEIVAWKTNWKRNITNETEVLTK